MQARGWLQANVLRIWTLSALLLALVCIICKWCQAYTAILAYAAIEYFGIGAFICFVSWSGNFRCDRTGSKNRVRLSQLRRYVRRGWTICLGQLAALIYGKFDVLLVTRFSGMVIVADYLFAQRIFDLAGFITGGASSVMYSNMARKIRNEPTDDWHMAARRWGTVFALLSTVVGIALWVAAPPLIRSWFPGMSDAIPFLRLFGLIAVLIVINQFVTALLNSMGRFALLSRIAILNLFLVVFLGAPAFYFFGTTGLLLSIALVHLCSAVLQISALGRYVTKS